ncbi:hypothetical protein [Mycolicibacterium llatzerense]|uniref:hypothetical protein n=1 Tax=Mycolicibacterium llatzerense TaxID=280871 RepID=UPI0021B51924|nr:hypothetical protein [Mycolicibacterium llatzerense]MCT7361324.1 hypothetical protein [Mycolicibacterium llatzerense]
MSADISDLADVIETGWPPVQLVACKLCGVLLWDAPSHYRHAHSIACVVDGCQETFIRRAELNAHSREHHLEPNPFGVGNRYPGVDDSGDFKWHLVIS